MVKEYSSSKITTRGSPTLMSYFVYLGTFIVIILSGNVHVWLGLGWGCTKMSPEIGTVFHWQPPNEHIFMSADLSVS